MLIQPTMQLPGQPAAHRRRGVAALPERRDHALSAAGCSRRSWWSSGRSTRGRGRVKVHEKPTGRLIERFTAVQRYAHWVMAISFVILGITGIVILLGKHVLLPVIGYTLFAWLTQPVEEPAQLRRADLRRSASCSSSSSTSRTTCRRRTTSSGSRASAGCSAASTCRRAASTPARRRGSGSAWSRCRSSSSVTGLILHFPNFDQVRAVMIQANIIHAIAAVLVIAAALGHIYMGTIGVEGAYRIDAQRLRRRNLGEGAPPALVRRRQVGQGQGRHRNRHPAVRAGPTLRRARG